MIGKVRNIRYLTPGIAVIQAVGGLLLQDQLNLEPTRNSVHTIVAVVERGTWKIAALQNTRVAYIGSQDATEKLAAELRKLL